MAIIYQKTPGQLIAQPGRAVSTFQTGIVRIDQTYICASIDAARHREAMFEGAPMPDGNSSPCIDGVFISPIPGEVDRGDGFTEFRVSGYGRSKSKASGLTLVEKPLQTLKQGIFQGYVSYKVFIISGTVAVVEDGSFDYQDLSADEDLLAPFDVKYEATSTTWTLKKNGVSSCSPTWVCIPFTANSGRLSWISSDF
jgi:hypothetical protein